MSDIIQDAKQLLDGATPAPWVTGGKDESGNIYIGNPSGDGNLVATSGICDAELIAAAPGLAQALAEETYEYRHEYQAADDQQWYALTPWTEGEPDRRPWDITPTRIVRRRVSPAEVVDE